MFITIKRAKQKNYLTSKNIPTRVSNKKLLGTHLATQIGAAQRLACVLKEEMRRLRNSRLRIHTSTHTRTRFQGPVPAALGYVTPWSTSSLSTDQIDNFTIFFAPRLFTSSTTSSSTIRRDRHDSRCCRLLCLVAGSCCWRRGATECRERSESSCARRRAAAAAAYSRIYSGSSWLARCSQSRADVSEGVEWCPGLFGEPEKYSDFASRWVNVEVDGSVFLRIYIAYLVSSIFFFL